MYEIIRFLAGVVRQLGLRRRGAVGGPAPHSSVGEVRALGFAGFLRQFPEPSASRVWRERGQGR